jgi:spermidine dehydrogenase
MKERDRKLGIGTTIKRRDFIGGVGVALSGSLLSCPWAVAEIPPDLAGIEQSLMDFGPYYPPVRTGIRGSHTGSFEVAHQLRNGVQWDAENLENKDENYDLVVVGGGISGLSAAWFYRQDNPDARILILDNHDDFGGHAKRNEFWHGDQMLLSHGGTINIEDFNQYGAPAQHMLRSLGIDPERYSEFLDEDLHRSLGLQRGMFFDRETFGTDRLVAGKGKPDWREFLAKTPLSKTAQADIARLYETRVDYMAGLSQAEKRDQLKQMSYNDFLVKLAGVKPESLPILNQDGYWAIGNDALSAWTAVSQGAPGTAGLGFASEHDDPLYFQFPDGNASIARLLVRSMIPAVAPGSGMEDIVAARFDYSQLDQPQSPVRLRLESTVIGVRHLGEPQTATEVEITYVRDGRAQRVKAGQTVLACYNSMIPYLCEELPQPQKLALSQSLKAPLIYASVVVSNWQAFANLGVYRVDCPGSYFGSLRLSPPVSIGNYQHAKSPREPTVVQMFRTPLAPGLSAQEQWRAGRRELLSTSFETFERHIRDQLGRALSAGGFDPARDIEAITVNRWAHGYTVGGPGDSVKKGRQPFGRITIANCDSAPGADMKTAIDMAARAVGELG